MSLVASLSSMTVANVAAKGGVAAANQVLKLAKNRAKTYLGGKVISETEQVDEFAGPIYTGVAASTAPEKTMGVTTAQHELSPEFQAAEARLGPGNNIRVLSSEKVYSGTSEPEKGVLVECVLFKERIIDTNQQRIGSFRDVVSDIRNGKTPTLGQCLLAFVDVATLGFLSPLLKKVQLQPHQYRLRWVQVERTNKNLGAAKATTQSTAVPKSRTQTGVRIKEKTANEDVTVTKQYDAQVSNVTAYSTEAMDRKAVDLLADKLSNDPDAINKGFVIAPKDIVEHAADVERKSIARLREQIRENKTSYDAETVFYRIGKDLKQMLGKNVSESNRVERAKDVYVYHDFINEAGHLDLNNVRRYKDAMEKLSATATSKATTTEAGKSVRALDAPTEAIHFKNGWITWAPGGSIANLGLKKGLHAKLTKADYISAGVDAATIAFACAKCAKVAKMAGAAKTATGAGAAKVTAAAAKAEAGAKIGKTASSWDKLLAQAKRTPFVREIRYRFLGIDKYARPGTFRKSVRDAVWKAAKDAGGHVHNPINGQFMSKTIPWDMGHKPGHEFWKLKILAKKHRLSRTQFLDMVNDPRHYRPEPPWVNRPHLLEDCTKIYYGEPFSGEIAVA